MGNDIDLAKKHLHFRRVDFILNLFHAASRVTKQWGIVKGERLSLSPLTEPRGSYHVASLNLIFFELITVP